jgi:Immunoglobulin I-set domain
VLSLEVSICLKTQFIAVWAMLFFLLNPSRSPAACPACTTFQQGIVWGYATTNGLSEASGLASSGRNPGVLWTHNDGSKGKLVAISTNGTLLATYSLGKNVDDVEDIAIGPGPTNGVSFIYVGDIGGNQGTNIVRPSVKLLRIPEPGIKLTWADKPHNSTFNTVDSFTLLYPDGSYDAETLLVDPLTKDVFVLTKESGFSRVYRANVNAATNKSTLTLEFVRTIPFSRASGGDISPDGTQIVVRREDSAMLWARCTNETVGAAFSRTGTAVPVIGPPSEPNGEAIAFLHDGTGYVTLSEGIRQPVYFFQSLCPAAPHVTLALTNQSSFVGGFVEMTASAVGYPTPSARWLFNGHAIPNQTGFSLTLTNLALTNAGQYSFVAYNSTGAVTNSANLTVRLKPDLRITEVMPVQAASPGVPTGDWWELTSFESQPVNLSGWRFNDNSGALTDPFVLGQNLFIHPGESIVFVEDLSPAQFRSWWGAANLPKGLQIITYSGTGLSLGATGDGVRLWDNMTNDPNNPVAEVDFGTAEIGVSFNFDPVLEQFGGNSQLGVNGVIQAASATDIGSPGRIIAPAVGPVLSIQEIGLDVRIGFDAVFGHVYSLEVSEDLVDWSPTGETFQPANNTPIYFEVERISAQQFFRVRVD